MQDSLLQIRVTRAFVCLSQIRVRGAGLLVSFAEGGT
jgi:hypothetical protein